jgi:hypothetical protein
MKDKTFKVNVTTSNEHLDRNIILDAMVYVVCNLKSLSTVVTLLSFETIILS